MEKFVPKVVTWPATSRFFLPMTNGAWGERAWELHVGWVDCTIYRYIDYIPVSLLTSPLYPSRSPGSPGFSRFLLSPALASATSNMVTPTPNTINQFLLPIPRHYIKETRNAYTANHQLRNIAWCLVNEWNNYWPPLEKTDLRLEP